MRASPGRLALAALLVLIAGCSGAGSTRLDRLLTAATPAARPPAANSPLALMQNMSWCWENLSESYYRQILSSSFLFDFGSADSSGRAYRDNSWNVDDERLFAHNLFVAGSVYAAPASSITLSLTSMQLDVDLRPGRTYPWHQAVYADMNLNILKVDGTAFQITGPVKFYVARGDSAGIPADLGAVADSSSWYLDGCVDLAAGTSSPQDPTPTRRVTLGMLRDLYR
jgi:hypothetical protein